MREAQVLRAFGIVTMHVRLSGYRVVLVEDIGELFPDLSYRMRRRPEHQYSQFMGAQ